jgi:hypothetical protein
VGEGHPPLPHVVMPVADSPAIKGRVRLAVSGIFEMEPTRHPPADFNTTVAKAVK